MDCAAQDFSSRFGFRGQKNCLFQHRWDSADTRVYAKTQRTASASGTRRHTRLVLLCVCVEQSRQTDRRPQTGQRRRPLLLPLRTLEGRFVLLQEAVVTCETGSVFHGFDAFWGQRSSNPVRSKQHKGGAIKESHPAPLLVSPLQLVCHV